MHLIDVLHVGLVHLIFGALWPGVDKTNVFSNGDLGPVAASGNNTFDHLSCFTGRTFAGRNFRWKKLSWFGLTANFLYFLAINFCS